MNKNNYTPPAYCTKNVMLPQELNELAEAIAKNVHEVWSAGRMADGWTYGEQRDDEHKIHPFHAPCEEMSEDTIVGY